MKKQTKSNIKAHLIRSSFYVLLLLAVCVIPFALAQRHTTRHKVVSQPRHVTTAAMSRERNDVAQAAVKGKAPALASQNRFTTSRVARPRTGPDGVACFYGFTPSAAPFVPGDTDIGNHTDDGLTFITLPFTVNLYGGSFTGANVGSNGALFFGDANATFGITCPPPFGVSGTTDVLGPYWGDQCTNTAGCGGGESCAACGVFTTTTGTAPNRVFYIEWRTQYFNQSTPLLDYEVALYENATPPFSFIYSNISAAGAPNDSQLVVGQKEDETCNTEIGCDTSGGTAPPVSSGQAFDATPAGTPTPTPTPACTPLSFEGTIDASDPTQTDRLFRDGIPSTCDAPKVCPGPFGDGLQHHYDSYTITNTTGASACVSVDASTACVGTNYIFLTAYDGSFDPTDLCTNYLADQGSSPDPSAPPGPFSFTMADGQTVVIVVAEVTADTGCPDYTVTVSNLCNGGGGPCTLQPWEIVAPYSVTSESVSVSTDGTFAYAAGGFDGIVGAPTNAFNQYDPVADAWTPLPNVPGAFYDGPSVYAANTNRVYVFGGLDATFLPSNVVQVYDVASNTWVANGAPMPGPRYFAGAAYYSGNGKIYVISGFDDTFTETSTTWEYDPVADTWDTSRANTPIPLGGSGYSIIGQTIYMAGTWNGGTGSTVHYAYDIVADTWTQEADVPVAIYRPGSASIGTNEYLVGGGNPFVAPGKRHLKQRIFVPHPSAQSPATSYNTTYVYDSLTNTWSNGPNTNAAHGFTGGTAIGNDLIVVTGFDGGADTNTVEKSHCGSGGVTPTPTPIITPTPTGSCPPVITESTSQTIVDGNSAACNAGGLTAENHYWRAFNMNTFTGGADYFVTSVEFGIEVATSGTGTGQPATVNLYANHGSPFPDGDWASNLIATTGPLNIPDQVDSIFNAALATTLPGSALEFVMEVFIPNGENQGNSFFIGSNTDPQTGPSYISSVDCAIPDPVTTDTIGFPDMHIVFNVNGSCGATPTPTPIITPTPVITPTPIITPTPVITPTPIITPTPVITPTPIITPTPPPRSPTPRPRPTPHPRPTPP